MKADSRTGTLWWLPRILGDTDLDATDTLLMVALAEHIGPDDRTIVGIARLADGARCSYPTAKRRLADLEERGYIERERRRRGDGNMSTYETFLLRAKYDEPGINMIPDQGSPRRALTRDHLDDPAELPRSDELPSNAQARLLPENEVQPSDDEPTHDADESFERFWRAYPRGRAGKPGGDGPKKPARRKWRRLTADQRAACLTAVDHYREHVDSPAGPYAAHATTWLNQERWEQWQEPADDEHERVDRPGRFVG